MINHRIPALLLLMSLCFINACSVPTSSDDAITLTRVATPASAPSASSLSTGADAAPTSANSLAIMNERRPPAPTPNVPPTADPVEITFAFEASPLFLPAIIMDAQDMLTQRGYTLKLVPLATHGPDAIAMSDRFAKLRSGEWDILATSVDQVAQHADLSTGTITSLIAESAGADILFSTSTITKVNELKGKRIGFGRDSADEFFLYYALNMAGIAPNEVTLVPQLYSADAVAAFAKGQVDAIAASEPDLNATAPHGTNLCTSDEVRSIIDVLVTGRPAMATKSAAIQAFHTAWYEALRVLIDTPNVATRIISQWNHPAWPAQMRPTDTQDALETYAQATLNANIVAFQTPDLLVNRLREAHDLWTKIGRAPMLADPTTLVDGRFVQALTNEQHLLSLRAPVNSTLTLTSLASQSMPPAAPDDPHAHDEVVTLPLQKIDFVPNSTTLTEQAIQDLTTQIVPALQASTLSLKIEGGSAWPGPEGRFTSEQIRSTAAARAEQVAAVLVEQGVDRNRLMVSTLSTQFPNSLNEAELAQDRIVRFTLVNHERR